MSCRIRNVIYDLPLKQFSSECTWQNYLIGDVANVLGGGTPDTNVMDYWEPPKYHGPHRQTLPVRQATIFVQLNVEFQQQD